MTIEHHPPETMLAAYAAGTLDLGQHVAIATHLASCRQCREAVADLEHVGGAVLEDLAPEPMSVGARGAIEALLARPAQIVAKPAPPPQPADPALTGLPRFVQGYRFGSWKWIAPAVHLRPIVLPHASDTRVFLLRSGPGTKMLDHSHSGTEMTCVLSGAFRQDGERFGPGDFDFGDESIEHQPVVEEGEACICLVAMTGELKLKGLVGRIMQPFIRL